MAPPLAVEPSGRGEHHEKSASTGPLECGAADAGGVRGATLEAAAPEPPLLTGEHWQAMSSEAKIAYIAGVGNLVEYERHQMDAPPAERQRKSFLP
jgi:hypothetical protein